MKMLKLLLIVAASGCSDPLKSLELIEETRVIGARVEVAAEPERATPLPGEAATLRWFVAAPEPNPALSFAISVCVAKPSSTGIGECQAPPFAVFGRAEPVSEQPLLAFTLPTKDQLGESERLLARGVICPAGASLDDPTLQHCSAPGTEVTFQFDVGSDALTNKNPTFGADAVRLDGAAWPALANLSECGTDMPSVSAGSGAHNIEFVLDEADRDPLAREIESDPAREPLLLSHFVTAGKLERPYSSIDPEASQVGAHVTWTPPAVKSAQVVRLYVVVRDLRGGADLAERALCVVP